MNTLFLFNIGFLEITFVDFLDIALVSFLLYQLYQLMKGSVATKIFLGFLSIYLFYLLVKALGMELLTTILGQFMGVGVIAALILFQQEIRRFLLMIGKTTDFNNYRILQRLSWQKTFAPKTMDLTPIIEASKTLGGSNTGALVVFAKSSELKFYAESGDIIDAAISKRLLLAIFNKHSPLHDGAVIISNGRLKAARCIIPVSEREDLPASFGLRHRAAIGMTEATDSVVLVVSEETGEISLAKDGYLHQNVSKAELRSRLNAYLYRERARKAKKSPQEGEEPQQEKTAEKKSEG